MPDLREFVRYTSNEGDPVEVGGVQVTPLNQVLRVKLPYWQFVWNRPTGVLVDDGETVTKLPIVDLTLLVQAGMMAIGMLLVLFALLTKLSRDR